MACCQWMRSSNDWLFDSETKKGYCGTCWQQWLSSNRPLSVKSRCSPRTNSITATESSGQGLALVEDDDSIGALEGMTHTDGELYLISRTRKLVFLSERTESGKLQCVGEVTSEGNDIAIKLYKVEKVSSITTFPFPTSSEDHCETPFEAYSDLAPYLGYFAKLIGKDRRSLHIWDPFYCDGAVKRHLGRLGFENVRNECEDFYCVIRANDSLNYDCIVTNPPYSTDPIDHVQELLKFLCSRSMPWFVVQPNYVYTKPFWQQLTATKLRAPRPFFLTPTTPRKYKYKTPSGIRIVSSAQHLKTSPFVTMWYCWLGPVYTEKMYRWISAKEKSSPLPLSIACAEYFLPDSFKDSNDKSRRKKRKGSKSQGTGAVVKPLHGGTSQSRRRKRHNGN